MIDGLPKIRSLGLALDLKLEEREWDFEKKGNFCRLKELGGKLGSGFGLGEKKDWDEREREKLRVFSILGGDEFASEMGKLG